MFQVQPQSHEAPKNVGCTMVLSIMQLISGATLFGSSFMEHGAYWYLLVAVSSIVTGLIGLVSACTENKSKGL